MNELYRYLTLAVSNEWRRQGDRQREEDKAEFAAAVQSTGVAVHAYSLVGTRADADLLLWIVADELDSIRAWEARCAATRLWAQSSRPYAYLAARRPSPYLGSHSHSGGETERPAGPVADLPYLVVYPMTKKRSWYALPREERTRIMAAHFATGHRYPDIRIHTGYSFGIRSSSADPTSSGSRVPARDRRADAGLVHAPGGPLSRRVPRASGAVWHPRNGT